MSAIDLKALRAAAVAATPGEWNRRRTFGQLNVQDDKFMLNDADALFIAAANPAVVLELLDRLERAEAEVKP